MSTTHEDARGEVELLAVVAERIAAAVEPLVVQRGGAREAAERRDALEDVEREAADAAPSARAPPSVIGAVLVEDQARDAELADVVQQTGAVDAPLLGGVEPAALGNAPRDGRRRASSAGR